MTWPGQGRPGGQPVGGSSWSRPGGPPGGEPGRGPNVLLLALGLLGLVMAVLALLRELAGVGPAGEWVAPTAALTAGGVLVVVGIVGLFTRRR